jgi:hypothetical protein
MITHTSSSDFVSVDMLDAPYSPESPKSAPESVLETKLDSKPQSDSVPKWGYFVFYLLGIGSVMGMFMYIVSLDFYKQIFQDFTFLAYIFNLVFNVGGWFVSTFFALPIQSYIRPHKIMTAFFTFNFFVLCVAIALNYTCTLPAVMEQGSSSHWAVMSLLIICVACHGITYGINSSCIYSVTGPISPNYTSAVMAGSASAGFVVALLRMIAKGIASAVGSSLYVNMVSTNVFFSIAALVQLICIITSALLIKMPFTEKSIPRSISTSGPVDIELVEIQAVKEGTDPTEQKQTEPPKDTLLVKMKEWFQTLKASALPGFCVTLTFFITYSLYPGVISDYQSNMNQQFNDTGWFLVSILAIYSMGDWLGRSFSVFRKIHFINYKWLWAVLSWRVLFFPLFILFLRFNLSVYDPFKFVAGFALSFTGGYLGSVSMMQGAELAKGRRYAGSVMTFWLNGGIALGAIFGIILKFATASMPRT